MKLYFRPGFSEKEKLSVLDHNIVTSSRTLKRLCLKHGDEFDSDL